MTDHESSTTDQGPDSADSRGDAIAAVVLILIAVATVLYWISGQ